MIALTTTNTTLSARPGPSWARIGPTGRRTLALASVALLLASLAACSRTADAQPGGGGAPQAMPVAVVAAKASSVPVLLEAVGRAEGSKEVEVRARVAGLIEQQRYREGDRVKADAPLFLIERAPFEIALALARAGLGQEQARQIGRAHV